MIENFIPDRTTGAPVPGTGRGLARAAAGVALWVALASHATAEISAKVVAVADGSNITIATERAQARLRLSAIDAPDFAQPHGKSSRQSLAGLCLGKTAALGNYRRGAGGRINARVLCDGIDAGEEQVRRGLAWVDPKTVAKDSPLYALEAEAKAARRGLWADPAPMPPWVWRRKHCCTVSVQ